LTDSSLVARRLPARPIVTRALPEYLSSHGEPRPPAGRAPRSIIITLSLRDPFVWKFGRGDRRHDLRVDGRLRFSSAHACLAAARAGFGIARVPAFVAADDLRAGRIVPLMH